MPNQDAIKISFRPQSWRGALADLDVRPSPLSNRRITIYLDFEHGLLAIERPRWLRSPKVRQIPIAEIEAVVVGTHPGPEIRGERTQLSLLLKSGEFVDLTGDYYRSHSRALHERVAEELRAALNL